MIDKIKNYFIGYNEQPLQFKYDGIVKYIPLIICGGFFPITILLFVFGPIEWPIKNPGIVYSFLIFCIIALILGYLLAVKTGKTTGRKINIDINKILILCAVIYFILYFPTTYICTGKWYPDIITGIFNTGGAYRNAQYFIEHNSHTIFYVRILLSPFMIMIMPLTIFFMPKLTKLGKILGITVIILTICLGISQGINKAFADFTAQMMLFLGMFFFSNSYKGSKLKHRFKVVFLMIVVCSIFFLYYSTAMRDRVATDTGLYGHLTNEEINISMKDNATFNVGTLKENYLPYKIIPLNLQPSITFLASYLSHGYYGLSIAMDQEFTSTYGMGFSDYLRRNVLKIAGESNLESEIYRSTYMSKTSRENWETGLVWSTFFVYPASDISFPGTVILVFFIGYLFSLSWKDAICTENPFAIVVFFGFCTMIFYFSANNQMFQGGEPFVGFSSMIILWLVSRHILLKKANK